MSEAPKGSTVERATRDTDSRTHLERINPGDNPADGTSSAPGAAPGAPPMPEDPDEWGPRRPYRLLVPGVHGDVRLPGGSVIMLHDHEVGAQHELVERRAAPRDAVSLESELDPEPEPEPEPRARAARAARADPRKPQGEAQHK